MVPQFVVTTPAPGTVAAWSTVRLPFEPKGWLADFRAELRDAVRGMARSAGENGSLVAAYTSADPYPVDAENVLLYNVGTSWFGRPSTLLIERAVCDPPPAPVSLDGPALHHHRYAVAADVQSPIWRSDSVAADWDTGPTGPGLFTNAATVWAAIRGAQPATIRRVHGVFGMEVTITAPDAARRSLPGLTKSVLDGAIAALHDHDGTDAEELSARVAVRAGIDPVVVRELLQPASSTLGDRRLLHRFGAGVQWNPADDRCVSARLRLEPGGRWRIAGRLFPVVARERAANA